MKKKYGENGKFLKNVIIHQKLKNTAGNYKIIIAEEGELKSDKKSNVLQLLLKNGNYYEEIQNKKTILNKPHVKSYFKAYTTNVDLEILNNQDLEEKKNTNSYNMLDVKDLNYTIDSLQKKENEAYQNLSNNLYNRTRFKDLKQNTTYINQINTKNTVNVTPPEFKGELLNLIENPLKKTQILNNALSTSANMLQVLEFNEKSMQINTEELNKHIHALHEKFALGISCIILFFIGAPLGALIRKGGLGLPIVVALVLFLTYHFFGLFAKKLGEKNTISPELGAWLSTTIMLPLSIYLTNRATNDKGVFSFDFITIPLKNLFNSKQKLQLSETDTKMYNNYKRYSVAELVALIKKQDPFDFDKKPKEIALHSLLNRNLTLVSLKNEGLIIPDFLVKATNLFHNFIKYSKYALITYAIAVVSLVLFFVFRNNDLPLLANWSQIISLVNWGIITVLVGVCIMFHTKFYHLINLKEKGIKLLFLPLILALFPLAYIIIKSRIEQDFYYSNFKNIT